MQDPKYHILFLTAWYPNPDDVQLGIFIKKHAQAVSLFCKVTVVYIQGINQIEKPVMKLINRSGNFNEHLVFYRKSSLPGINRLKWHHHYRAACKDFVKLYGSPDLVHLNVMYGMAGVCNYFSSQLKVPYIITEHWHGFTNGHFGQLKGPFRKKFFTLAADAKHISCVSLFLKKNLFEIFKNTNTSVIPNVVESYAGPVETASNDKTIFLTAADLIDDVKNISAVIEVMCILFQKADLPYFEYHIIGSGRDEAKLKSLVKENCSEPHRIVFHSRQSNDYVLKFLAQADCAIINSITETFSVFAAEAVLCGKPVISTRCGGPEDFLNNDNSILIKANDKPELKDAVESFLKGEHKFESEKVKASLGHRFSSHTIGSSFFKLYDQIIRNP